MVTKAKESAHVLKARKKLRKQFEKENKHVTTHALQEMSKSIHHWLERHKSERIYLKDHSIKIFDENQHPVAPQSKFITNLMNNLKQPKTNKKSLKTLEGRISQ